MPNFTFCVGRKYKTTTFFFFSGTSLQSFRIQLQFCQHLANWTRCNKRDKVWRGATSLFKWRFFCRICRCSLSSPLTLKGALTRLSCSFVSFASHTSFFATDLNFSGETKSQLHVKQICLLRIVTNNRNELWRTVRLTSFQKIINVIRFNLLQICTSMPSLCCVICTFFSYFEQLF